MELIGFNEKVAGVEEVLGDIRETLTKKDAGLREAQSAYHMEKSRLEALSNLTERYEGYGGSVKKVMEQKEKEKGIIGVVADIIKVEKKYETAIETALGGNIQNIVTDNEETAKRMIGFLKTNRLGRATFLPLTSITRHQEFKNSGALSEKGVIGLADELVRTEDTYRDVAKAMLGRILVVDNVDNAVKIARKYEYGIRMVTLEGELLVPGGAISGGAFKNNSNLLGRRREIDELEKSVKKLLLAIDKSNREIDETKAKRNQLRMSLEALKADIQRKSIEQNTARLNIGQTRERIQEEVEGAASLKLEEKEIEGRIFQIKNDKESAQKELAESEALEAGVQEQIAEFQQELEIHRSQETEASTRVSQWELKVEKMRQESGFKQTNVDRIQEELGRCRSELEEILEALEANRQEIEQKSQNLSLIHI